MTTEQFRDQVERLKSVSAIISEHAHSIEEASRKRDVEWSSELAAATQGRQCPSDPSGVYAMLEDERALARGERREPVEFEGAAKTRGQIAARTYITLGKTLDESGGMVDQVVINVSGGFGHGFRFKDSRGAAQALRELVESLIAPRRGWVPKFDGKS